jgi:hypothetical protein
VTIHERSVLIAATWIVVVCGRRCMISPVSALICTASFQPPPTRLWPDDENWTENAGAPASTTGSRGTGRSHSTAEWPESDASKRRPSGLIATRSSVLSSLSSLRGVGSSSRLIDAPSRVHRWTPPATAIAAIAPSGVNARPSPVWLCGCAACEASCCPVPACHSAPRSLADVSSLSPSGLQTARARVPAASDSCCLPVARSHTRTVPSPREAARRPPSGEKAKPIGGPAPPSRIRSRRAAPPAIDQTSIVVPASAVAIRVASGPSTAALTG